MIIGEKQNILNIIKSSIQSEFFNQVPYLQLPIDIEILTYDDKKAIGYVVIVLPMANNIQELQDTTRNNQDNENSQAQLVELMHIPFVYKEGFTKFLFIDIHGDVYPFSPQILRQYFNNMAGMFGYGGATGSNFIMQNLILSKVSGDNYRTVSKEIFIKNDNKKFSKEKAKKEEKTKENLKIPERVKEKIKTKARREKIPKSYFLMPEEKKFPYKDPDTGEISCALLKGAITRASQHKYLDVKEKAQKLYQKHCKKDAYDLFLETIDNIDNFSEKEKFILSYADMHHVKYAYDNKIEIKLSKDMFLDEENMLYLYKNPITKEIDTKMLIRHMKIAGINNDIRRYAFAYAKYLDIKDNLFKINTNRKSASLKTMLKILGLTALGVGGLYLGKHIWRLSEKYKGKWHKHFFDAKEFAETHSEIGKTFSGGIDKLKKFTKKFFEKEKGESFWTNLKNIAKPFTKFVSNLFGKDKKEGKGKKQEQGTGPNQPTGEEQNRPTGEEQKQQTGNPTTSS